MKAYLKIYGKAILLTALCALLGLLPLLAVFALPTEPIEANVSASADVFAREGSYPRVNALGANTKLDNFTDALMLMNAAYEKEGASLLARAIDVYRPNIAGHHPTQVLVSNYGEGEAVRDVASYGRYWHGYLVTLKPLLSFLDYEQIRVLNAVVVAVLALGVLALMYRRNLRAYMLPYAIALLLIDPVAIAHSLQFMNIYCIYSLAAIVFLWKREWLCASQARLLLFFTGVGCATSFLDLLSYPLLTFAMPATLWLCGQDGTWKTALKGLFATLIAWGVGYVGMWAGKWILGSLLGGENIIQDAIASIQLRSSASDLMGARASVVMLFKRQLACLKSPALALAALYLVVTGVLAAKNRGREKFSVLGWLPYIALCALPVVWYLGAFNHSYVHAFFTYRELFIPAFCGMCLFARYATKRREAALTPRAWGVSP